MKTLHRITSVLLVLCLLLGAIPALTGLTAKAATTITSLKLTDFKVPVIGETAPGSPVTLTGKHVKQVGSATWYKKGASGTFSGSFTSGGEYYVRFVLEPESGYTFPSQLSGITELVLSSTLTGTDTNYVDASYCKLEGGKLTIESKYVAARSPTKITRIGVAGYKQPNPGEPPQALSTLSTITNAKYTISSLDFYNVTNHCMWTIALNNGEVYYPIFSFKAAYGYYFPNQPAEDFEVYSINGVASLVASESGEAWSDGKGYFMYGKLFTCYDQTLISSVTMQGFVDPVDGEAPPDKFFNMSAQHCYLVSSETQWREMGSSSSTIATTFREGKRYFVRFVLVPNTGYHFPASISDFTKLSLTRANETENLLDLAYCRVEDGKLHLETILLDAQPSKQINTIAINGYKEPKPGEAAQTPSDLTVSSSAYYTVDKICYYSRADSCDTTTFEEGKTYYARIYLRAKYGYTFPDQVAREFSSCKINGGTDYVDMNYGSTQSGDKVYVLYTRDFTCHDPMCINSLKLTDFVNPAAGELPPANFFKAAGQHVTLVSAEWKEKGGGSFTTFNDGKQYYVRFTLQPTSGYHFPGSISGFTTLTLTRPDSTSDILDHGSSRLQDGKLILETGWIYARSSQHINDIAVTGYEWPMVGGTPLSAGQLSVPSNAPYRIEQLEYKCTAYSDPASTFEAGKRYYAKIYLRANYGYTFENQWANQYNSCTINGGTDMLDEHYGFTQEGGKVYVLSTATAEAKSTITSVNVTGLVKPKAGEHPVLPTLPSGAQYMFKKVYWYNLTDAREMDPASDVFEEGKTYFLHVDLEPKSSYVFPSAFSDLSSASFDGNKDEVDKISSRITGGILTLFTVDYKLPRTITKAEITGYVKPAADALPATPTVASDAPYTIDAIRWFNRTSSSNMTSGERFAAGSTYYLVVDLKPKSGWAFPESVSDLSAITINGSSAEVDISYCTVTSGGRLHILTRDCTVPIDGHTPGDVNGDGKVNNKDAVLLFRYLKGEPVTVVPGALDVNGSGSVNQGDVDALFDYLSGKSITLY